MLMTKFPKMTINFPKLMINFPVLKTNPKLILFPTRLLVVVYSISLFFVAHNAVNKSIIEE